MRTGWLAARMGAMGVHDCAAAIYSLYPGAKIFNDLYGKDHATLDDRFFLSLGAYTDVSKIGTAWLALNPYVVGISRLLLFLAFYGVSFLTHPGRLFRVAREVFSDRQISRGAMALRRFLVRKRESRTFARPPWLHDRSMDREATPAAR